MGVGDTNQCHTLVERVACRPAQVASFFRAKWGVIFDRMVEDVQYNSIGIGRYREIAQHLPNGSGFHCPIL